MAVDLADPELVTMLRMKQFEVDQEHAAKAQAILNAERAAQEAALAEAQAVQHPQNSALRNIQARFFGNQNPGAQTAPTNISQRHSEDLQSPTVAPSSSQPNEPKVFSAAVANATASATGMAGSAAAYANRLFKTGFARLHADNNPGTSPRTDDLSPKEEMDQVEEGGKMFGMGPSKGYGKIGSGDQVNRRESS